MQVHPLVPALSVRIFMSLPMSMMVAPAAMDAGAADLALAIFSASVAGGATAPVLA
jgi:hypothetical protein